MTIRTMVGACALVLTALSMSACAGPGDPVDIGVNLPAPERPHAVAAENPPMAAPARKSAHAARVSTNDASDEAVMPVRKPIHLVIHAHNQQWPSWMIATDKLALNYITSDDSATNAPEAVHAAEAACRLYTRAVHPSDLVAVIMNGTVYAATQFPFALLGASALQGAQVTSYAENASAYSAGGGVGNGFVQLGGKTYTFENCGRGVFEMAKGFRIVILEKSTY